MEGDVKDKIIIDAGHCDLEIWNVENGIVTAVKFDNQVFVKQKGEEKKIIEIPESKKDILSKEPTKKRKGGWSSKEEELLKKHYPTMVASEIVEKFLPNRTEDAVSRRAFQLKIRKDKHYKKRQKLEEATETIKTELTKFDKKPEAREWTVKEEDFLRDNFFKMGPEGIVKNNLLNRTEKEIRAKASQMGMIVG